MNKWKLWLDDQWDDPEMPFRHPPDGFIPAKSTLEAMALIEKNGVPSFISFDHDLGLEEGCNFCFGSRKVLSYNSDDPDEEIPCPDCKDDKSTRFIDWLTTYHYDADIEYQIHSANPVGRDNIISKMKTWKKSKSF